MMPMLKRTCLCLALLSCALLQAQPIKIYGHRGARGLSPENTLPSYRTALTIGVNMVDMDITLSKDKQLVVYHDLVLNPATTRDAAGHWVSQTIPIKSLTLAQLQQYDVGQLNPDTAYAKLFPLQKALPHTPMPSLQQVIAQVQSLSHGKVGFQIEIKTDPTQPQLSATPADIVMPLYRLLKQTHLLHSAEIQAFDWRCLRLLNQLDPKIKTAYLTARGTEALSPETDKPELRGMWTAGLNPKDFNYDYPRMVKHLGGHFWEPYAGDLSLQQLQAAHRLGLKVVVWSWPEMDGTNFKAERISKLIRWGVDGLITDRPDALRGLLAARDRVVPSAYLNQG